MGHAAVGTHNKTLEGVTGVEVGFLACFGCCWLTDRQRCWGRSWAGFNAANRFTAGLITRLDLHLHRAATDGAGDFSDQSEVVAPQPAGGKWVGSFQHQAALLSAHANGWTDPSFKGWLAEVRLQLRADLIPEIAVGNWGGRHVKNRSTRQGDRI